MAIRSSAARVWHLAPYLLAVSRRAPLQEQVRRLPRLLWLGIWWIELRNIPLATDVRIWRRPSDGFSIDGNWDTEYVGPRSSIFEPATDATVKAMTHDTIRALFIEGQDYRKTAQYDSMIRAIERGAPQLAYGCQSRDDVDAYFAVLLDTFQAMSHRGYLTQQELGGNPRDEIKLYVTRDGRWCHGNGGNHRIRIAELLQIQWVPFVVAGAHSDWITRLSQYRGRPPRAAILDCLGENERQGTLRH